MFKESKVEIFTRKIQMLFFFFFIPHKGHHKAGNTVFESKYSQVAYITPALVFKATTFVGKY